MLYRLTDCSPKLYMTHENEDKLIQYNLEINLCNSKLTHCKVKIKWYIKTSITMSIEWYK